MSSFPKKPTIMKHLCAALLLAVPAYTQAQTPEELKSWLPEVQGWTVSGKVEVFSPGNLWDRINGSAPLFLENNFKEMTAMEYTRGEHYITIQAYRHATPEDTFGMYASERSPGMDFLSIGAEAQGDDTNIYFFAGNMYVKIWSNAPDDAEGALQKIAKGLAGKIAPHPTYPPVVEAFPLEGRVPHTEAYITSGYLGHKFLNRVYTTDYTGNGETFQVFILDAGTREDAAKTLTDYCTFTGQSPDFGEDSLWSATDRYNGDIPLLWKGQYIIGVYSENGEVMKNASGITERVMGKLQ